jgi:ketosteroid isomerase-like protein
MAMNRLIRLLLAALLAATSTLCRADEAAVRDASAALVQAWNRHDVKAWSAFLTADAWYQEAEDFYERYKGRDKAVGLIGYKVENSDLEWDLVRVKARPDGQIGVVLVERMKMLPKTDGKYQSVFTSNPSYARWRRDTDGRWRMAYFTSNKGLALAEMKKDEGTTPAAAASTPAAPPAARPKPPRGASPYEPGEYTGFYGKWAQGCTNCHGRPPGLPSSELKSRIVAVGAAAPDGAALRIAMQSNEAMRAMLEDPALTDAALDWVRRFLVHVRDGALPETVAFDAAGATRVVELRNERSSRDAAVKLAVLRASGPFKIDAARSTCRRGGRLAGQASCTLVVRAGADAPPGASGALEVQFAPTPGLEPKLRQAALRVGG